MSNETDRLKVPYPSKTEDAYYDTFERGFQAIDACVFADFEHRNCILHGGDELSWTTSASGMSLTWTEDIAIQSPAFGQKVAMGTDLGPVIIPSGYFLYLTVPRGPTEAVEIGLAETASQIPINNATMSLAWHNPENSKLIWRTGLVMNPDSVVNNGVFPITEITYMTGDALSLRGVPICTAAETPSDGDHLMFDSALGTDGEWCMGESADRKTYTYIVGKGEGCDYSPSNGAGKQLIQDAIDDANTAIGASGDTAVIFIQEGVYSENLTIRPGIDIMGAVPAVTHRSGETNGDWGLAYRTVIEGRHVVIPYTVDPGAPDAFPLGTKSTTIQNIRFQYSPAGGTPGEAVLTFGDITPIGAEVGIHQLRLRSCSRFEAVRSGSTMLEARSCQFLRWDTPNCIGQVGISLCHLTGGTLDAAGGTGREEGTIYASGEGLLQISDSLISMAQVYTVSTDLRPSIGIGNGCNLSIQRSVVYGMIESETTGAFSASVSLDGCLLVGRTLAVDGSRRAAISASGTNFNLRLYQCEIESNAGTSDGQFYAVDGSLSGDLALGVRGVLWAGATVGGVLRYGVTPSMVSGAGATDLDWQRSTVRGSTSKWEYSGVNPADIHTAGTLPATDGTYFAHDVEIDGKLTVTGLIDPTGIIFDYEDEALVPTGAAKGAFFVSDGSGAAGDVGQPYFKAADGSLSNLLSTGAATDAEYLLLSHHADLQADRVLAAAASELTITDGGAKGNATIGLATVTGVAGNYTNADITVDSKGRVTVAASGSDAVGMTGFDLDPAAGGIVSVADGATVALKSDDGDIEVDKSGAQGVSFDLTATGVVAGAYVYPSLTVDSKGRISLCASRGVQHTDWGGPERVSVTSISLGDGSMEVFIPRNFGRLMNVDPATDPYHGGTFQRLEYNFGSANPYSTALVRLTREISIGDDFASFYDGKKMALTHKLLANGPLGCVGDLRTIVINRQAPTTWLIDTRPLLLGNYTEVQKTKAQLHVAGMTGPSMTPGTSFLLIQEFDVLYFTTELVIDVFEAQVQWTTL